MSEAKLRPLTKKEIQKFKEILEGEKQKLIFKNVYVSEEFNVGEEERSDEVDQANADFCNSQRLRFRNRESFFEKKIDEALRRIADGTYGKCLDCDAEIGAKRLNARPTAELCIYCKEESERDENASIVGRKSKSLGNELNLVSSL